MKRLLQLRYDERKTVKEIAALLSRKDGVIRNELNRLPKPTISKSLKLSQKDVEKIYAMKEEKSEWTQAEVF